MSRIERKTKMGYEVTTCSRCGGTGHYSYCQAHGTTCFKCGGTGVVLSKRGHATREYFENLTSIPAHEVKVGMKMRDYQWLIVEKIEPDTLNEGCIIIETEKCRHHVSMNCPVRIINDNDHFQTCLQQARDYQEKLTKTGKLMKRYEKELMS